MMHNWSASQPISASMSAQDDPLPSSERVAVPRARYLVLSTSPRMTASLREAAPRTIDEVLRQRFGLEAFRPWQREAIEALLSEPGRVLVVAPTGGGKSLTYQLPAALLNGLTLVVSPLVALMEDQVRSLATRGIRATYLASTLDLAERQAREAAMMRGDYEIVYVAPERLANVAFVERLARCKLALVAVDEAHCIAQWGHDFRPEYLQIGALLERLEPPRVLACTATATPAVRAEIVERLGLGQQCHEVLRGFARPNLHLAAQHVDGPREARAALESALSRALGEPRSPRGGAIVYAATRKATEQYAALLSEKIWNAAAYHAGMSADERTRVANRFASRKIDIVVATNAFGMGIDRADIRCVVHVQPPSSIEAYYQEVGRAGRDGAEATGLLLCSGADIGLRRRLVTSNADGSTADEALAARAWALFRDLLRYLDARTCRHDFVLRYFGDEHELLGGCGHCDVCLELDGERAVDETVTEETTLAVKKALSAVARAQRRGGLQAIAEMLRGVENEKTERFGFTKLSTFGLFRERSQDWILTLLRALLAAGWIDLTPTEHPVPYITRAGASVMKGEAPARIVLPAEPRAPVSKRRPRAEPEWMESSSDGRSPGRSTEGRRMPARSERAAPTLLDADAQALFERLRARRAEIAKQDGMPAYVIAHDRTLVDMAQKRPLTRDALLGVHGMGPARIEQYGERFLDVLVGA
jgi:ATP-dependent DNA helicase RecQ